MARSLFSLPAYRTIALETWRNPLGFLDAVGWLVHFIASVCGFVSVSTEHAYGAYIAAGI